jgi:hypothetical protein
VGISLSHRSFNLGGSGGSVETLTSVKVISSSVSGKEAMLERGVRRMKSLTRGTLRGGSAVRVVLCIYMTFI